jgi:hypothetical protein
LRFWSIDATVPAAAGRGGQLIEVAAETPRFNMHLVHTVCTMLLGNPIAAADFAAVAV